MEANLIFANVRAYNITKFDAKNGESFSIELVNADGAIRWFSDNDQVLSIAVAADGESANIQSTSVGKCEIQLQKNGEIVKTLIAEVYDDVATSLNPTIGQTVMK